LLKNIKLPTEMSPDFKRFHVTDFYGGMNSGGELSVFLIEDDIKIPNEFNLIQDENNPHLYKAEISDETTLVRRCHAQITIPTAAVPGIITWLQSKMKDSEQRQKDLAGKK
jgi:hypothetical protein